MVTEQIVRDAFFKASEDRKEKPVVVEFQDNLDDNCKLIADVINSGKTGEYVKYIQLKRKNTNGKWRDIDAPAFFTLVMQHVWIMLVKPLYMEKETSIARNCIEVRGICSEDNWINLFCGRKKEGSKKLKAFAFHGNMKCIHMWIRMLEEEFGGKSFLPIEDVRLIKRRGYLLDGTAEVIEEIDPDEYYRNQQTENEKDI